MRRSAPRPIDSALAGVLPRLRPATTLARVQAVWSAVVGAHLSAEASPVAERDGTVTVRCRSAVWAQELELLSGDLAERLNGALADAGGERAVASLRFVSGGSARTL